MRNAKIENLALICAVLVVSIHIGISGPVHSFAWCMKEFVAEGVARIAVPFFFVVSGYFLGQKYQAADGSYISTWRVACRKRVRTLMIPYWIWNALYAPLIIGVEMLSDSVAGRTVRAIAWLPTVGAISGVDLVNKPILFQLWYVRSLFIFAVLSVAIWPIVRRIGIWVPVLLYAVNLIILRCGITLPNAIPCDGLAYFSLGLCVARGFKLAIPKWLSATLVLVLLAIGFGMKWLWPEFNILYWWIPSLLFGVWGIVPGKPLPKAITSLAFPIYILHPFVLLVLQYAWHLTAFMPNAAVFLFRWCVATICAGVIARVLIRYFPRLAGVVFGGRI